MPIFSHGWGDIRIEDNPFDEINGESDRACALVAGAICEKRVEHGLRSTLTKDANVLNSLFQPDGPLGAFKSKATLAYAMGLLSPWAFNDLKIIVSVRNDFAHKFSVKSFGDQSITGRCANLQSPDFLYHDATGEWKHGRVVGGGAPTSGRERYVSACLIISNSIVGSIEHPEGPKRPLA